LCSYNYFFFFLAAAFFLAGAFFFALVAMSQSPVKDKCGKSARQETHHAFPCVKIYLQILQKAIPPVL
jgi:hypothetical protein